MEITVDLKWLQPFTLEELLKDVHYMVYEATDEEEMLRGAALVHTLKQAIADS